MVDPPDQILGDIQVEVQMMQNIFHRIMGHGRKVESESQLNLIDVFADQGQNLLMPLENLTNQNWNLLTIELPQIDV